MSLQENHRILLVDDMPAIHEDFRKILTPASSTRPSLAAMESALFGDEAADLSAVFELDSAYQGVEALAMLNVALAAGRPYALAFVDMRMPPGWDGVETIERLWQADPLLQVVICTAYSDHSWESVLARLQMRDQLLILKKPFDAIEVSQLARALTAKWQRSRQLEQSHTELAAKEEELRSVVEHLADGVVNFDDEGIIRSANPMMEWIFGYAPSELLGRSIAELVPALAASGPGSGTAECHTPSDAGGTGLGRTERETQGLQRSGDVISLGVAVSEYRIKGRRMHTAILRDISERVAVMAALEHARRGAEQASVAKSAFVATMSHELRTPMNGVIGMIGLLEHSRLDDEQSAMLGVARESARSLLEIIEDILDFSKIEAGKLELEREPISVVAVVEKASKMVTEMAARKSVEMVYRIDPSIPSAVWGDALRLNQVLVNLTTNAIKFSSGRDIAARVAFSVVSRPIAEDRVVVDFVIDDNGIGMDSATLGSLFIPFSQADATTTRRFGGTGLGLAISRSFVELMGGEILVSSTPEIGSTFTVRLPLEIAPATSSQDQVSQVHAPTASVARRPATPSMPNRPEVILVAEDNEINQKVIMSQLKLLGFAAEVVGNGLEALARWREGRFAILLTDLQMPQMNGYELARSIRGEERGGRRIPIVALTANALKGEATRCEAVGMDGYLTKPVQLATLEATLIRYTAKQASEASLSPAVLPSLPELRARPVDPRVLIGLVGDDPTVLRDFLVRFSGDAAEADASFDRAMETGRCDFAGRVAHKLKASARAVGATDLGDLCATLEIAADASDEAQVATVLALLQAETKLVREWIGARYAESTLH